MKKIILATCFLFAVIISSAQSSNISLGGTTFNFPSGVMEWSDPIKYDLRSKGMIEKGIEAVPLQFRIKVKKRKMMACHFYVEIKNLSDKTGISFSYFNSYTDASGKVIFHKVKLAPSGIAEGEIIYSSLDCKVKTENDCTNCTWAFEFDDIKVK